MELDLNSQSLVRQVAGQPIIDAIDRALLKAEAEKVQRDYLGGSYIGGDCERSIQYQFRGTPKDPDRGFEPHVLRIFERGHRMEDMAAAWLRQAGFYLKTEDSNGRQFGFASANGRFKGHADGVIVGWNGEGSSPCSFPALWENKALNAKNFDKVVKHGLKKAKPVYYAQVALYQYHLQLMDNPCVFTVTNADTMQMHVELVPFDAEECQRMIDRAVKIIRATDAGETLPRTFSDPDGFGCRFCDFKTTCWG